MGFRTCITSLPAAQYELCNRKYEEFGLRLNRSPKIFTGRVNKFIGSSLTYVPLIRIRTIRVIEINFRVV